MSASSQPFVEFRLSLILLLSILFVSELIFLPMPGIQEDEMLFALPFLSGHPTLSSWGATPVMLMDYIGALKTWIYWPIFKLLPLSVWSVRLPVCLLGLITVGLFANFTRRVSGARAGLFAAALLATDAPFVLTNVFDWGPVCLLILGTVAFLSLMHRFFATGNSLYLASGWLVAGLCTWYKALYVVLIAAMAIAWPIVYGRKQRGSIRKDTVAIAVLAFLVGAAPLIAYNATNHLATVTASRDLPVLPVSEKLLMMRRTLDGRALEHYMFRSFPGERIPLAGSPIGDLVEGWYRQSSFHPGSLLFPAVILSLFALPFLRASSHFRSLCFAWIAAALAFGAMLLFRNAGGGPHHTVLLYPAPQFIAAVTAVAVAERVRRRALAGLVILAIAASNLWLIGQYAEAGRRNGFSVYWSDGVANLARDVESTRLPAAFLDWGILNSVQTMSRDRIRVAKPFPLRSGVRYVTHCDGYVIDASLTEQYRKALSDERLALRQQRIVTDRRLAPVFCTFEVVDPGQPLLQKGR